MKPLHALYAIMAAFPLLYVTGAVIGRTAPAILALAWVAVVCLLLLRPEKK